MLVEIDFFSQTFGETLGLLEKTLFLFIGKGGGWIEDSEHASTVAV